MPRFQKKNPTHSNWYFRPHPKFQNLAPHFCPGPEVSKKVCHTPCRTKTQLGDGFPKNRPLAAQGCTLEAGWSETQLKNYLHRVALVLKISLKSFHSIKSYSTFSQEQTDHALTSIYGWAIFMPFYTFRFTIFMKDNQEILVSVPSPVKLIKKFKDQQFSMLNIKWQKSMTIRLR